MPTVSRQSTSAFGVIGGGSYGALPTLTSLRGVAALLVFLCHAWWFLGQPNLTVLGVDLSPLAIHGWVGVLIFFVLSGFLLAPPYIGWNAGHRQRPDTSRYLWRRARRVFPAYWLQLVLLVVLLRWQSGDWPLVHAWDYVRHMGMLLDPTAPVPSPLNAVWWTLPVELSFYLCLPLLAPLLTRNRWPFLLVIALGTYFLHHWIGAHIYADADHRALFSRATTGYLVLFIFGLLAAMTLTMSTNVEGPERAVSKRSFAPRRLLDRWAPLSTGLSLCAFLALLYCLPSPSHSERFWNTPLYYYAWKPVMGLVIAALIVLATKKGMFYRMLSFGPLLYLGQISYGLYLWHFPILTWVSSALPTSKPGEVLIAWLVGLAGSVCAASLSWHLIESPALNNKTT